MIFETTIKKIFCFLITKIYLLPFFKMFNQNRDYQTVLKFLSSLLFNNSVY